MRPPSPVPVSIDPVRADLGDELLVGEQVGGRGRRRRCPSQVVCCHGRLRHTASVNAHRELLGHRRRAVRHAVGARRRAAPSAKASARQSRGPWSGERRGERDAADVVDRLARAPGTGGPAARRSAGCSRTPATGARPASGWLVVVPPWTWWNEPSPRMRHHGDVGRRAQPLVELEVGEAAAGHEKLSSNPPTCSSSAPGDEHAVALPHPVEPVAVADEVADLEEPVARPSASRSSRTGGPRSAWS